MTLSEDLEWRGLLKDKTFDNISWLNEPRSFYLGIDPTADSLTAGNLAIILLVKRLAHAGWHPFLVMGGGTSLVGDPGGKTEERQLMKRETIISNIASIKEQVTKLFHGDEFTMVDNYDWLSKLKYIDFIRDVGKHFSMTELIQRDFVKERMGEGGSGISYTEFSYSLVQGYDFWHLFTENEVIMQVGGSDQWGNLLSGVALIRKKEGKEAHALSMPLVINKATGKKFGKSEAGAVWLDPKKTSPTQFYQFWINVDDEGVEDYLKVYTELDKPTVESIMIKHRKNPKNRFAQKRLAQEVTGLVHGKIELGIAEAITKVLTGELNLSGLSEKGFESMRQEIPAIQAEAGDEIIEVLASSGLADSKTEARRLLAGNAIAINGEKTAKEKLEASDFQNGRLLIRKGKAFKDSALVELA